MKTILSLGRLHPLKGLDLLISAWAEVVRSSKVLKCESPKVAGDVLKCESPGMQKAAAEVQSDFRTLERSNFRTIPWQLVIAGPDEQGTLEKLKVKSEKLKLIWREEGKEGACEADIVFLGPVHGEAKWALMKRADIFVLPSRSENFGIVVGEALACGVPVVTTAVGPWGEGEEVLKCESSKVLKLESENIEHPTSNFEHRIGESEKLEEKLPTGHCRLPIANRGLIVVETSAEGIAEGLQRMMALSDAERQEMGRVGAEWVTRELSWEAVAKKMVEAYEK